MTEVEERWFEPSRKDSSSMSNQASETVLALARARSRLPSPAVVTLKKIGELQVQADQIAMIDDPTQVQTQGMVWFRLARAPEQAWLGVTLNVCHGLIRAILGAAPPLLIRPLGSAETGLVTAVVASALSSLGLAHRVTFSPVEGPPCWQGQQILLTGAIRGGTEIEGRALFIGPLWWLVDGAGRSPLLTSTENSVAEGVLVLGRTMLPAADLGAAAPGDAIVFDGIPGLVPGVSWPVTLVVGRSYASASLEPNDELNLVGSWEHKQERAMTFQEENAPRKSVELTSSETTSSARSSAELVAELGRIKVRGNELAELSKGRALNLGPRPGDPIVLRVDGQFWATGELITLGEQMAVRIVRLHG
jgi:flagellar motor switch/type III secretory pathway protein FliN